MLFKFIFSFFMIFLGFGDYFITQAIFIKKKGEQNLSNSYVSYLIERLLGLKLSPGSVDALTLGLALLALFISLFLNFKKRPK